MPSRTQPQVQIFGDWIYSSRYNTWYDRISGVTVRQPPNLSVAAVGSALMAQMPPTSSPQVISGVSMSSPPPSPPLLEPSDSGSLQPAILPPAALGGSAFDVGQQPGFSPTDFVREGLPFADLSPTVPPGSFANPVPPNEAFSPMDVFRGPADYAAPQANVGGQAVQNFGGNLSLGTNVSAPWESLYTPVNYAAPSASFNPLPSQDILGPADIYGSQFSAVPAGSFQGTSPLPPTDVLSSSDIFGSDFSVVPPGSFDQSPVAPNQTIEEWLADPANQPPPLAAGLPTDTWSEPDQPSGPADSGYQLVKTTYNYPSPAPSNSGEAFALKGGSQWGYNQPATGPGSYQGLGMVETFPGSGVYVARGMAMNPLSQGANVGVMGGVSPRSLGEFELPLTDDNRLAFPGGGLLGLNRLAAAGQALGFSSSWQSPQRTGAPPPSYLTPGPLIGLPTSISPVEAAALAMAH